MCTPSVMTLSHTVKNCSAGRARRQVPSAIQDGTSCTARAGSCCAPSGTKRPTRDRAKREQRPRRVGAVAPRGRRCKAPSQQVGRTPSAGSNGNRRRVSTCRWRLRRSKNFQEEMRVAEDERSMDELLAKLDADPEVIAARPPAQNVGRTTMSTSTKPTPRLNLVPSPCAERWVVQRVRAPSRCCA